MRLMVSVSMTRPSYGDGREAIEIQVTDDDSGVRFLEVQMSFKEFVKALTSSTGTGVAEVRWLDKLGTKREFKTELVPFDLTTVKGRADIDECAEILRQALAPFEVDGWVGCRQDLLNWHRRSKTKKGEVYQSVSFTRYVEPTPDDKTVVIE